MTAFGKPAITCIAAVSFRLLSRPLQTNLDMSAAETYVHLYIKRHSRQTTTEIACLRPVIPLSKIGPYAGAIYRSDNTMD
jgi:hypothetical protein